MLANLDGSCSFAEMTHASPHLAPSQAGSGAVPPKPRDEELDFFGLTHPGKVRKDNQDNFLVCTLHKTARVRATSLPNP